MCSSSSSLKNFDQLYSQVCEKLRNTNKTNFALEKIHTANSDFHRIQFVLNEDKDILNLFSENALDCFEQKDEKKAEGLYDSACSEKSLLLINQALTLCTYSNDSKFIPNIQDIKNRDNFDKIIELKTLESLQSVNLIANIFYERSKILFQNKLYDQCIKDIFRSINFGQIKSYNMVLQLGESLKNLEHLDEAKIIFKHSLELLRQSSLDNEFKSKETIRVIKLVKEMQQLEASWEADRTKKHNGTTRTNLEEYNNLFEGPNKILIGTSSAVELRYNSERGRHMMAIKTIPPGSTIIVEKPYAWSISKNEYHSICQNCTETTNNGVPCFDCSSVMFCSEECRESAYMFHKYECKILQHLNSSDKLGTMAVLCFRTIAKTQLSVVLEEYKKICKEHLLTETLILGLTEDGKLDSSNYSSVFAQTTNSVNRNPADLLKRTYAAIYLTMCLRHVGYFVNDGKSEQRCKFSEIEEIVAALILRHLQSVSCNGYGINKVSKLQDSKTLEIDEIGGATYPIISTTNHSCNCNVYRINIGKICIVKTLQEIDEGSEILDSYGPLYTIAPKSQRTKELEIQYLFQCTCDACLNNWPTFTELRTPSHKNVYKCPNCQIGVLDSGTTNKRNCFRCGKIIDLKKVQKLLRIAEDKYLAAKEAVLQRYETSNVDLQKSICNYILTVQKVVVSPCKEIIEAQEILKLYWNLCVRKGHFP